MGMGRDRTDRSARPVGWSVGWLAFKGLLSSAMLAVAIWLACVAWPPTAHPGFLLPISLLIFFAALPWVRWDRPSRALGLVLITLSFGAAFAAYLIVVEPDPWPRACSGRHALACELINLLHSLGGVYLAALPFAGAALVALYAGVRMAIRPAGR
ncbi:MAG: hypothetical protein MK041_12290 [Aquabacterium sp.]|nr:hypothetical protein [Aquabacterium sp.]